MSINKDYSPKHLPPKTTNRQGYFSRWGLAFLTVLCLVLSSARAAQQRLTVTQDMLSGSLEFFASPAGLTFNSPVPYGVANNLSDSGWIWPRDNSGLLQVDFGVPTALSKFRVYTTYNGGQRGANWAIEYSADAVNWTKSTDFPYVATNGGGVDDDGVAVVGFGGWYATAFNSEGTAARYWRIKQTAILFSHAARSGEMQFFGGKSTTPSIKSTFPGGHGVRATENIIVEIEDGSVTSLDPAKIKLTLNEVVVTPVLNKPGGSKVTTVTYDLPTLLPEGTNNVEIIFGDTGVLTALQTNKFIFVIANEATSALVVNVDFKGARNDPGPDEIGVTFLGMGPAGGGNFWNVVVADSRLEGGGDDDNMTITANNLSTSLGDPTTIDFSISPVGGDALSPATDRRSASALFADGIFVGFGAQITLTSDFTISGLGSTPNVDLYFYASAGEILVKGGTKALAPLGRFFTRDNTTFFPQVPVVDGKVHGHFNGDPGRMAGLTLVSAGPSSFILSNRPGNGNIRQNGVIQVEIQDNINVLDPASVQLLVNGTVVAPTLNKPGGSKVTTVTYDPPGLLALGANNYRLIFGDTTTAVDQTHDFAFTVVPDSQLLVTPGMLSGPLRFFASPAGLFFTDPIPYGIANNASDFGWIWPQDNSGELMVDFGQATPLARFRVYSTYPGGGRGAAWSIEHSDDGQTWTPYTEFLYETKLGGAVEEVTGAKRTDTAGWYEISFNENGAKSHRHWRVKQARVTIGNAPRSGGVQFFSALPLPSVKSVVPIGRSVNPSSKIMVELQDNITAVNLGSVQLMVNGQSVAATVDRPVGSIITTVSFKPNGGLRSGLNTARIAFGNVGGPSIVQSFEFTFNVQGGLLDVYPSMLSGSLNFFASPAGLTFAQPLPYGIANNVNDQGWIWPIDNSGSLTVDFRVPAIVQKFRAFTSYGGAGRGANWAIEYSNDGVNFTKSTDFVYQNTKDGGLNDDGTSRTDFGGWFGTTFNAGSTAARYWRIRQTAVTIGHAPRTAQLEFSGSLAQPLPVTPEMLSGTLNFFASPADLTWSDPIPYGIPNNVTDQGWIWPLDAKLILDLGSPRALNLFRAFSSYGGGARGSIWTVERSNDGATWTPATDFRYETTGGGVNDDGSLRTDAGGWYSSSLFNFENVASQFWRIHKTAVTMGHAPRTAQFEYYAVANLAALPLRIFVAKDGADLLISWAGTATLQYSDTIDAIQWTDRVGATSPTRITQPQGMRFYRLKK